MALVNEGEQFMLQVALSEQQTVPVTFYIGLSQTDETTLGEGATLATISEVTGSGYARKAVNSDAVDWTTGLSGGDWRAISKEVTFSATGAWTQAKSAFLATTLDNTGKLLATKDLSTPRTLANGDSLKVTMIVKAQ